MSDERPAWLEHPGARVRLHLRTSGAKPELVVTCNPPGLASIAATLIWVSHFSDPSGISLSALPFVAAEGALALTVVMANEAGGKQGRIVRRDKEREFEWHIHYKDLKSMAAELYGAAAHFAHVDYVTAWVADDSDASMVFENAESR